MRAMEAREGFEERRQGMDKLLEGQARLEEKVEAMSDRVEWLEESIRGNGKPGINHRLMRIEEHMVRMDYWEEILIKIILPILISILGFGIAAWIKLV